MTRRERVQVGVSLLAGAVFLLLAFRNVSLGELGQALGRFHWPWLIPALGVSLLLMVLRTWRWQLELRPLERVPFGRLWAVTSVAYSAINLIPARLGEVVRPWLVAQFSNVRMSQAVGSLVVEKLMDSFCILAYTLAALLLSEQLPDWARRGAVVPAVVTVVFAVLVALAYTKGEQFVTRRVALALPERVGEGLSRVVRAVLEGMRVLPDTRLLAQVFVLSLLLWFLPILSSWIVLKGFGFPVPFSAALLVFLFIGLATAIPNPPAMVGTFQYACVLALGIYGIEENAGLAFGLLLNALQVLTIVAQGIVGAMVLGLRWADIRRAGRVVRHGEVDKRLELPAPVIEVSLEPVDPERCRGVERHEQK
ncbi:MAG: flippase-like domain-containing protein [Candidatus Binatia bacterium]|nr:flippase-like domain-containing protein [Candidatus Binatia bacterium]